MRPAGAIPLVLLAAGVVLVVLAVLSGHAAVALVVVLPVVYGASAEFLLGVVLLMVGFLTLPLAFTGPSSEAALPATGRPAPPDEMTSGVSGLILVGPVPIFLGGWKNVSLRTRILVAAIGAAVLVALLVVFLVR
jgi:uncharacterized membrane protein